MNPHAQRLAGCGKTVLAWLIALPVMVLFGWPLLVIAPLAWALRRIAYGPNGPLMRKGGVNRGPAGPKPPVRVFGQGR